MFALIRRWESSGLTQEQFFRQHNIAKSTFGFWRKKYLEETGKVKDKGNFVPVKISDAVDTENSSGVIELFYPNGVRLVCSTDMDISRLKPLIVL